MLRDTLRYVEIPSIIMFGKRPLADYIEKVGGNFAAGLGSWLGCNSHWLHYLTRWISKGSISYVIVRTTILILGP
jgi:hypothetical protein